MSDFMYETNRSNGKTLIAGIYPLIYESSESPIILELGRSLSGLDTFTVAVWIELWFYPELSYGGFDVFEILPDGALPGEDDAGSSYTIDEIPEGLRRKFVDLIASDMERFKEDGSLKNLMEDATQESIVVCDDRSR